MSLDDFDRADWEQHQIDLADDHLSRTLDELPDDEDEPWTCPTCKGRRTIQPDRNTPPEPCPTCVDEDAEDDLGDCPYYARYHSLPGHDPKAICYQLGRCEHAEEPLCITCEPLDGWPSRRADR